MFRKILKKMLPVKVRYILLDWEIKFRLWLPPVLFKKATFSQNGEDVIIYNFLVLLFGKRQFSYLDIGANHPFYLSNTALLYKQGSSGALVEPDPFLAGLLRFYRRKDRVIACGVHCEGNSHAPFYVMDPPTLNTFSEEEMIRYAKMGHRHVRTLDIDLLSMADLFNMFDRLDFLNLDIEGLDLQVLQSIDWNIKRPAIICVETVRYELNKEPERDGAIQDYMNKVGYFLAATTFINSIFIDEQVWDSRWKKGTVL